MRRIRRTVPAVSVLRRAADGVPLAPRGSADRAPRTSAPHPEHRVYPYLLRGLAINRANYVWCADITYNPVQRGFLYLVATMDWASRFVLAWQLSNTLDAGLCTDALDEVLARYGVPEIFNTDWGSQFTSLAFTARRFIGEWMGFYNTIRPHTALGAQTQAEAYRGEKPMDMVDKSLRALTTYPQAQQQHEETLKGTLAT